MSILGKADLRPSSESRGPAGPLEAATVVGPGAKFVGELTGDEDVVVLGRLEGSIRVGGRATVGQGGEVEGDVQARAILVQGTVSGQIIGTERAELGSTAVVEGSVEAPKIIIAEGARLEGSVAMAPRGQRGTGSVPRTSEA